MRYTMDKSTINVIYDAINDVLGGTNPNQMLSLTIPGTILNKETYKYDIKKEKPMRIIAEESRLANKLFDVTYVTGSDNGRQLATQYQSALDTLSPVINSTLLKLKDKLRGILESPASYTFDDGKKFSGTLQQLFYILYGDYVDEKKNWAEAQNEKKSELQTLYPGNTEAASAKRQEAYLEWYQTMAESYLLKIQVKRGKILGIFSVNDMKIIEGILDSGTGQEIEQAKMMLENAKKYNPDGGYVYPVTLQPSDWFESLDSNMNFIDLLKTSEAYMMEYKILFNKRSNLLRKIKLFEKKNKNKDIAESLTALEENQKAFDEAKEKATVALTDGTEVALVGILDFVDASEKNPDDLTQNEQEQTKLSKSNLIKNKEKLTEITNALKESAAAITNYTNATQKLADAAKTAIQNQTQDYTLELEDSYLDLADLEEQIKIVKLNIDAAMKKEGIEGINETLFPDSNDKRFTEILIETNSTEMSTKSNSNSSSDVSSCGVHFLFGGYSSDTSTSSSSNDEALSKSDMTVKIGFLTTKVSIVRNWFNPGVFTLTKDMYRNSSAIISDGSMSPSTQKNSIFPCYPTAFIIAKDISLSFSFTESETSCFKSALESHAAKGGGFFCFRGSSASSTSSSESKADEKGKHVEVSIKLPGPQIIGYYQEIVPTDSSRPLNNDASLNNSILDLVKYYNDLKKDDQNTTEELI